MSAGTSRTMNEQFTKIQPNPWHNLYSARARHFRASEIRTLFSVVSRPEVVSLAGGMPNIHDLPLQELANHARMLIAEHGEQAMQYGHGQGWEPLREAIVKVMRVEGAHANPENIVVTTGSQQAIDLITQLFVDPRDVILVEAPSYVGALGVFSAYQADVVHVPIDDKGLVPELLAATIDRVREAGREIKFLYTIPNFHNPGGISLSMERRPKIVEICRQKGVLIVEDNPYGLLGFEGKLWAPLFSLNPEGIVYLGSFSKIFAPGFRVGWACVPTLMREKMVVAAESAILSPSMVGQMAIEAYLSKFDWLDQIAQFRSMYKSRRDATLEALEEYMPDCSWTVPTGGFYTWVTLPEGVDSKKIFPAAIEALVAYTPGSAFYADGKGGKHLRLSYCYPTEERIREGVRRLSTVVNAETARIHG